MSRRIDAIPRGTDSAEVVKVIRTESLKGRGGVGDPCFIVTQYWSLDGVLLAEAPDPLPDEPNDGLGP